MENSITNHSCLELTIAMPGFSPSSSLPTSEVDMNQLPSSRFGKEESPDEEEEEVEDQNRNMNKSPALRKKLRLSKYQSSLLEESFLQNQTLNPRQKEVLADKLQLMQRQVEVWFQNRRARSKLKQTEMECEYLRRWFGSLTEQNRKLRNEVEELRTMKAGGHLQPPPEATSTLSMCPRCERVTANKLFLQSRRINQLS